MNDAIQRQLEARLVSVSGKQHYCPCRCETVNELARECAALRRELAEDRARWAESEKLHRDCVPSEVHEFVCKERDVARLGVVNLQQACELMRRDREEVIVQLRKLGNVAWVQLGNHRDLPEQVRNLLESLQAAGADAQRVQIGDHR